MPEINHRRSPRRALELPIRVFGTDFQGRDFVEDSTTLVVNRHGAKIQLARKLIPEQEIRILSQGNNREAEFRVVSKAGEPTKEFCFWGVECLAPGENIWEGAPPKPAAKLGPRVGSILLAGTVPAPSPKPAAKLGPRVPAGLDPKLSPPPGPKLSSSGRSLIQLVLRCSKCGMRELMQLDETQILAVQKLKGLVRGCPACGATGLWKRVSLRDA